MEIYCVSCKKKTANESSSVTRTKQKRLMLISNCGIFSQKKPRLIKIQEATRLLSKLGIRTPLSNIPLISDTLF